MRAIRTRFAPRDGLPFADVLPESSAEQAIRDHGGGWRGEVFTPVVTPWAFLAPVIGPVGCCRLGVARVMAWLVARGEPPCGPGTGGYCKARARFPTGATAQRADTPGNELGIREVWVRGAQRGFRTRVLVIATTLTDPSIQATDRTDLYRQRWHMEVGLRNVKVTLGMDVRGARPGLVRKGVWAHRLAFT